MSSPKGKPLGFISSSLTFTPFGRARSAPFHSVSSASAMALSEGLTIGGVTVESRVLTASSSNQRIPTGAQPLAKLLRKAAAENSSNKTGSSSASTSTAVLQDRDGRSFLYVLHYLSSGDLVYPLHEGFPRVDALLKELNFFGLAEDVMRSSATTADQVLGRPSPIRNNLNKRRSLLSICTETSSSISSSHPSLAKCHSLLSVDHVHPAPMMDDGRKCPAPEGASGIPSKSNRFIMAVKHYLSLKSLSSASSGKATSATRPSRVSTGVFRPATPVGSTLVLTATPDGSVTIYGLRRALAELFPDQTDELVSLKTTSSAFIDCQMLYYKSRHLEEDSSTLLLDPEGPAIKLRPTSEALLTGLYRHRLHPAGYSLTVRAQWRGPDPDGPVQPHRQWLLHRKNGSQAGGNNSRTAAGSIGKKLSLLTSSSNKGVSRRPSVIQRLFQTSSKMHSEHDDL